MSQSCPNCGTALLDSDTKCFRCGALVPGREPGHPLTGEEKTNLRTAAAYAGVVLALMVLGAVMVNWMGVGYTNPLEETPTPPAPTGWYECLSPQGDYRIWLPNSWRCFTRTSPEWEELAAQLTHPLPFSFERSEPRDQGERLSMIAQSWAADGGRALTLSIELHPGLADTPLEVLRDDSWSAKGQLIDTSGGLGIRWRESGERMLVADLIYPDDAGDYVQSVTAVLRTKQGAYAVSVEGIGEEFWRMEGLLWDILDSFQPLDRDRS